MGAPTATMAAAAASRTRTRSTSEGVKSPSEAISRSLQVVGGWSRSR